MNFDNGVIHKCKNYLVIFPFYDINGEFNRYYSNIDTNIEVHK